MKLTRVRVKALVKIRPRVWPPQVDLVTTALYIGSQFELAAGLGAAQVS